MVEIYSKCSLYGYPLYFELYFYSWVGLYRQWKKYTFPAPPPIMYKIVIFWDAKTWILFLSQSTLFTTLELISQGIWDYIRDPKNFSNY